MKIIFFGEDSFSNVVLQSLIDERHDILLVISPYYDNLLHKRLENTCKRNKISYCRIADFSNLSFIENLKGLAPEIMVITHFEKILKKEIIEIPSKGCINLHPSLLPNYRGLAPQHWPIINGDSETGVTVHYVDETADTGDIIIQKRVSIDPDMYVYDLQIKFYKIYKYIVVDAIKLLTNKEFTPITQSNLKGSYFGKLQKNDCAIKLNMSCKEVINLIKGVSKPYFGAFIDNIIIWKAHVLDNKENNKPNLSSQLGLHFSNSLGFYICLNDGIIIIDKYEIIENN